MKFQVPERPTWAAPAAAMMAFVLAFAMPAQAAPVITPTAGSASTFSGIFSTQANVVRWTLADSWTNVDISASLVTLSTDPRSGMAYLMNQVGPGATAANELASTAFVFAQVADPSVVSYVSLFSDLDLGPGSYFLVLSSASVSTSGISIGSPAYTTATGAVVETPQVGLPSTSYAPAGTFRNSTAGDRFFAVTGDKATQVPEPATLWLAGIALTLMAHRRVRAA